ncbi:MAG: ribosome maturation factor RimM [Hyphomicrobium sp.]
MTDKDHRILLGRIATAHGIRGAVVIESYTADPADIAAYGPLQSADGSKAFAITVERVTPRGVIARVAGVADRNAAEALRGTELFAARTRLPAAEDGAFYYIDLIGLRAENPAGELIGKVIAVQNYGAGDLLEVELNGQRATELLPFTDAFVPEVDVAGGRVVVVVPLPLPAADDEGDEAG